MPGFFERALRRGTEAAVLAGLELAEDALTDAPEAIREIGGAALRELREHAGDIAGITLAGFTEVTAQMALGRARRAEETFLQWLRHGATAEERLQARRDAREDAEASARRGVPWDKIETLALRVLEVAGRVAVPLLLSALEESP